MDSLDRIINYLNQIQNKDLTLMELFDDLANKKINNALIVTESLIQQEINQNIKLLKNFQKINPIKKNVVWNISAIELLNLLSMIKN